MDLTSTSLIGVPGFELKSSRFLAGGVLSAMLWARVRGRESLSSLSE